MKTRLNILSANGQNAVTLSYVDSDSQNEKSVAFLLKFESTTTIWMP